MIRLQIDRRRHEARRRTATVATIDRITPRMLRIGFTADLDDFVSDAPDDHIKLYLPTGDGDGKGGACMRDFTPRRFDVAQGRLVIDFALHDSGPATRWAAAAKIGDRLEIGGPRGSAVIPDDFDWYWLIGDATALPAIGRWVEDLRPDVPVTTFVAIAGPGEAQSLDSKARWTPVWCLRDGVRDDAALLRPALDAQALPPGEGFVWIAAEAGVARALRSHMIDDRRHPREWIKAAGYWTHGKADAHQRIED